MNIFPENWFLEIKNQHIDLITQQCKLHEEKTIDHAIAIYDTVRFGKLMLIDDHVFLAEHDNFIAHEMLAHPAIFSHAHPKKIGIFGSGEVGLVQEILKHPDIEEIHLIESDPHIEPLVQSFFPQLAFDKTDPRIQYSVFNQLQSQYFDVIFISALLTKPLYQEYFNLLHPQGILVQPSESPFYLAHIKKIVTKLDDIDFHDMQILNFPQPSYPSGTRSAILALKNGVFRRVPEKLIFNKKFSTRYYNYDIHKASLVLPEFARGELAI